jgi:Xaa-Pro dipeptidase
LKGIYKERIISMRVDDLTERKWRRVREQMRQEGVVALVLSENGRTRYISGYQRYYTATYLPFVHATVMTIDAGPVLLLPRHIMGSSEECAAEKVIEFPMNLEGKLETLACVLEDLGAKKGRVGIEFDFVHHGFFDPLKQRLRNTEIVDASPIMNRVIAVKFPEEIEVLRQAASMVDKGVDVGVKASLEGIPELEVAARSSECMLNEGAEFINHMTVRSGPHVVGHFPVPTSRAIQKGDCIMIDIGCVHQGYISDINRTVVVGKPSEEQRELMRVGQEMLERAIEAVRPGVAASDVWRASYEVAERAGMKDRISIPFTGHGIGLGLHEEPYIMPESSTVLEEGMVFALEPGVYAAGIGGSRPEDMILVTATGAEVLTHYPRDYDLLMRR